MTKTKRFSRIITFALAMLMVVAMAVPTFAASPRSAYGYSFSSVGNTAYQLNSHTNYTPDVGTKISMWSNTGSESQRWDMNVSFPSTTYSYMLNAANKNVTICYNGSAQAVLTTKSGAVSARDTQGIKLVDEGTGASGYVKFGLVLPAYVKAITATGYSNGAQAQWLAPNGQNNQLWYIGMFY